MSQGGLPFFGHNLGACDDGERSGVLALGVDPELRVRDVVRLMGIQRHHDLVQLLGELLDELHDTSRILVRPRHS